MRQTHRSWLSLLGFFVVITLGSSLIFAAVFAGVTAVMAGGGTTQASNEQQPVDPLVPGMVFSGLITDSHCGARHTDSDKSASECARMCVRKGSRYSIANGERNYELAGDSGQLAELAGQRVSLIGVLNGDTIKVSSAAALLAEGSNQR